MKSFKPFDRSEKDPNALNARSMILQIVFCLVCGILLIAFGDIATRITAYVLTGVLIICGCWNVIAYIRSKPLERITESRLAFGLILLVSGVILAFKPDYIDDALPFVWGLALLFGAFLKVQYAFDEKTVKVEKWWIMLIFAGFSLIIGVVSLLNPEFLGDSRNLVIGILLVVEAVLNTTVYFLLRHALKTHPLFTETPAAEPAAQAQEEVQPAAEPAAEPAVPAEESAQPAEEPAAPEV